MTASAGLSLSPALVGLDVAPMRSEPTGVGVYVRELAEALAVEVGDRVVRLGIRRGGALEASGRGEAPRTYLRGGHHLAWLLLHADADARRLGCRLVHWTNAAAPFRTTVPFVVSIQDLSLLRMPGGHPLRRLAALPFLLAAARGARRVIVPSEATARDVRRLLRVAPGRTAVIPLAARDRPAPTAAMNEGPLLDSLGVRPGTYVLALGTLEPRKNHVRLLAAFELLALSHPELRLVLAGASGWGTGPLERALRVSPVRDRVVSAGYVSEGDRDVLVRHAGVLAYVSLMEGYGLPVIEAMAAGTPVVTSAISSLPEVAGNAAVLVDPTDVGAIARGLEEALSRRVELVEAGLLRAAMRTWRDVAIETLEVYRQAAAE